MITSLISLTASKWVKPSRGRNFWCRALRTHHAHPFGHSSVLLFLTRDSIWECFAKAWLRTLKIPFHKSLLLHFHHFISLWTPSPGGEIVGFIVGFECDIASFKCGVCQQLRFKLDVVSLVSGAGEGTCFLSFTVRLLLSFT